MKPGHPPPPQGIIKDHRSIPPLLPPPGSTDTPKEPAKEPHHYHQNQPHPHPGHAKNPFYSQQQERDRQRASHNNAQNHHSHSSSQQQHSKPVVPHPSTNSSSFANWNQQNQQHHHAPTQPGPPPYKMPPAEQKPTPPPPPPSNKMGQQQQNHGNHLSHSKSSNNYHSLPTGQLLFDPSNSSSSLLPLPVVGAVGQGHSVKEPPYTRPASGSNNIKPTQHSNNLNLNSGGSSSNSLGSLAPTTGFQFPVAAGGGGVTAPQREKQENNPPRNKVPLIKPSKLDGRFGDSLVIKQEMKLDVVDPPFHTHSRTLPPQTLGMKEMGIKFDALDHESAVDISNFDGFGFGDLLSGGIGITGSSAMITAAPPVSVGVGGFATSFPTEDSPSVKVEKDAQSQSSSSGGGKHKKKKKEKHKDKDRERHKDEKKHKKDKHKDKERDRKRKRDKDGVSPSTVLTPPSSGDSHSERGNNMKIKILLSGDKGAVSVSSGNNKGSSKNSNLRS